GLPGPARTEAVAADPARRLSSFCPQPLERTAMSHDITRLRVVYEAPNEGAVPVTRDAPFTGKDGNPLVMDLYRPASADGPRPAVVLVLGYPDAGVQRALG